MEIKGKWITAKQDFDGICPQLYKEFTISKTVKQAKFYTTCYGVYIGELNGKRIGNFILAPGYTSAWFRVQLQQYDVTEMLEENNNISVVVAKGWWKSRYTSVDKICGRKSGLIGWLEIEYDDKEVQIIPTDNSWSVTRSNIVFSDIYDGETYDATIRPENEPSESAVEYEGPDIDIIPQEGEAVCEHEIINPMRIIYTPKGETVIDFGQNLTGYVEITVNSKKFDRIVLSHAEVLDSEGNFYNANYRTSRSLYTCICDEGKHTYKAKTTFFGFRYIRVDEFPGGSEAATIDNFKAISVYSDIKQTGKIQCSNPMLNQFFNNVIWSQRDNFLDIPTDCPQRDERLGWTGDAQMFIKTAAYNYDVERFFKKWLNDMKLEQADSGRIFYICPSCKPLPHNHGGFAGWSDAATICPWTLYQMYGHKEILSDYFEMMRKWVDFIGTDTKEEDMWRCDWQYGDWLGLDASKGSYQGASRIEFIATAYYAYSTNLVVKAGKILEKDVSKYEALYNRIIKKFKETFSEYKTQTECVLAIYFGLDDNPQCVADLLAEKIKKCGNHFETGFIGTSYLPFALSRYGYSELAYDLLLRKEYPSWLYSVTKGATTVWEHWDGIMEDGSFWSEDMNSFNHYAYGSVMSWVYEWAAGISSDKSMPGFEKAYIEPHPTEKLDWLFAEFETAHGKIVSSWNKQENMWRYTIDTPVNAEIVISGKRFQVLPGKYVFYSDLSVK